MTPAVTRDPAIAGRGTSQGPGSWSRTRLVPLIRRAAQPAASPWVEPGKAGVLAPEFPCSAYPTLESDQGPPPCHGGARATELVGQVPPLSRSSRRPVPNSAAYAPSGDERRRDGGGRRCAATPRTPTGQHDGGVPPPRPGGPPRRVCRGPGLPFAVGVPKRAPFACAWCLLHASPLWHLRTRHPSSLIMGWLPLSPPSFDHRGWRPTCTVCLGVFTPALCSVS